jgi:hypothetical protein
MTWQKKAEGEGEKYKNKGINVCSKLKVIFNMFTTTYLIPSHDPLP